jgi:hypothetical protein
MTLAGVAGAVAARQLARSPHVQLARMGGTTIAAPPAAGWVTDFLNAAYFRRPRQHRHVDALRLAFDVLTTRWHQLGRRLGFRDVAAFHRAFGVSRFITRRGDAPRCTLAHDQLLEGASSLFGDWFPACRDDPDTRGWGIVFPDAAAKAAYRPERRLGGGRLGAITPPGEPHPSQTWHTYPPVRVGDPDAVLRLLTVPERWPEFGTELGRFTPVRGGGLADQTFELEVVGAPLGPAPLLMRGYVTVTALHTRSDRAALRAWCDDVAAGLARWGEDEPPPVPDGATPVVGLELTTHEGHFLGPARNRLLMYRDDEAAWLRAVGTWDPMDWQRETLYRRMGRHAQHAFWGMGRPEESMLHQIAEVAAGRDRPVRQGQRA